MVISRGTGSSNPSPSSGESGANPNAGEALQAFGIYAVGFVSRPVGAALFGQPSRQQRENRVGFPPPPARGEATRMTSVPPPPPSKAAKVRSIASRGRSRVMNTMRSHFSSRCSGAKVGAPS